MQTLKLFFFLLVATIASGQTPTTPRPGPDPRPHAVQISGTLARGDVVVRMTKAERDQVKAGKIVWKRVVRALPPNTLDSKRFVVFIDNFSHPGPTVSSTAWGAPLSRNGDPDWLLYDPRNLKVTRRYIRFDAPAGDHIFYVVAYR